MSRWSDSQLVCRILAGEQEACTQLVDAHHEPVYRFLWHLCMDGHLAEDLTQETFMTAWTRLAGFNGSASLATWLHRIAFCKFVDWHRRNQRVTPIQTDAPIDEVCARSASPSDVVLADEQERELSAAVARLDQADRGVLALHYFQGFSYSEMAEVLGIRTGLAKWRTSQALSKLRQLLGER